ncbi:MAG: hypothetical protein R3B70_19055 [Polyangiaceae bacterium]
MNRNRPLLALLAPLTSLALTLGASTAFGFAEDLCYLSDGSGVTNCNQLACAPGVQTPACIAGTLANAGQIAQTTSGGRSMVHTDSTYYLAQAVGFDAEAAYWIAAYNEATDLGQYVPADRDGNLLVDPADCNVSPLPAGCEYVTAVIDGVTRTNGPTGGMVLHYGAPMNDDGALLDGLHPDVHDEDHEVLLVNLRNWLYSTGEGCTAGLTVLSSGGDYATGPTCYETASGGGELSYYVPLIGITENGGLPITADLGPQIITDGADPIYADEIDLAVGTAHVEAAKLGIYVHAAADRISHHICEDTSALEGPDGGDFTIDYDEDECGQPIHAFRHAQEVGVNQSALPAADRTTQAALELMYDELRAYAAFKGHARMGSGTAAYRSYVIQRVLSSLQVANGAARQDALIGTFATGGQACSSAFKLCFPAMPGM